MAERLFICIGDHGHDGMAEPEACFATLEEARDWWLNDRGTSAYWRCLVFEVSPGAVPIEHVIWEDPEDG